MQEANVGNVKDRMIHELSRKLAAKESQLAEAVELLRESQGFVRFGQLSYDEIAQRSRELSRRRDNFLARLRVVTPLLPLPAIAERTDQEAELISREEHQRDA